MRLRNRLGGRWWFDRCRLAGAVAGSALILDISADMVPSAPFAGRCASADGADEVVQTRAQAVRLGRVYDRIVPGSRTHWLNKPVVRREGALWRVIFKFPIDGVVFDGSTIFLICASNGALAHRSF